MTGLSACCMHGPLGEDWVPHGVGEKMLAAGSAQGQQHRQTGSDRLLTRAGKMI